MQIEPPLNAADPRWLSLRQHLWPHASEAEDLREMRVVLERGDCVLLGLAENGAALGFVEASKRTDYVNGTDRSPVAFLEGLYVDPDFRRNGVSRALVAEVERWALAHGCSELASDSLAENVDAHAVHRALGFRETERVVFFCKRVLGA